jgi:hypothetical protein
MAFKVRQALSTFAEQPIFAGIDVVEPHQETCWPAPAPHALCRGQSWMAIWDQTCVLIDAAKHSAEGLPTAASHFPLLALSVKGGQFRSGCGQTRLRKNGVKYIGTW